MYKCSLSKKSHVVDALTLAVYPKKKDVHSRKFFSHGCGHYIADKVSLIYDKCAICLSVICGEKNDLFGKRKVIDLHSDETCHPFHLEECIKPWVKKFLTCPTCRKIIRFVELVKIFGPISPDRWNERVEEALHKCASDPSQFQILKNFILADGPMSRSNQSVSLQCAAFCNDMESVSFLAAKKSAFEGDLIFSIFCAISNHNREMVELLLDGENLISTDKLSEWIGSAAARGDMMSLQILFELSQKYSIPISSEDLGTTVIAAIEIKDLAMVEFLLPEKDLISADDLGVAILAAIDNDHLEMVQLLLTKGSPLTRDQAAIVRYLQFSI